MIRAVLGFLSGGIALVAYAPYARDILRGNVRPARASRCMFALLLIVTLLQQKSLGSGAAMAVTIGEAIGSLAILALSARHGVGGWQRIDKICYALLATDLLVWQTSRNAFAALLLSTLADAIAFAPTLRKTWRDPKSETPIFFAIGAFAPLLGIVAAADHGFRALLFPAYLVLANALELGLIYRPTRFASTAEPDGLL